MVGLIKNWINQLDDWWFYKFRKSSDKVLEMIINKELKPYNITMKDVIANPKIDGEDWFIHYTFNNQKEYDKWEKYSIKLIKKHIVNDDKMARREFSMVSLNYGLKTNYDNRNKI